MKTYPCFVTAFLCPKPWRVLNPKILVTAPIYMFLIIFPSQTMPNSISYPPPHQAIPCNVTSLIFSTGPKNLQIQQDCTEKFSISDRICTSHSVPSSLHFTCSSNKHITCLFQTEASASASILKKKHQR